MSADIGIGHIRLQVPDDFRIMTDDEYSRFFTGQPRTTALICESDQAVLNLSWDESQELESTSDAVTRQLNGYASAYERITPGFQRGEMLLNEFEGGSVGVMTFKSNAPTRDLFNVFCVISAKNTEHTALFSCSFDQAAKYVGFWSESMANIRLDEEPTDNGTAEASLSEQA